MNFNDRGFTLVEVLVALAIVAVSFVALFGGITQVVESAIQMQDRTFASWVAYDQMTEQRLAGKFPEDGSRENGEVEMAGATYTYSLEYSAPEGAANIRKMVVRVADVADPELLLAEATGVLVDPNISGATQSPGQNPQQNPTAGSGGPQQNSGAMLIPAPDPDNLPQAQDPGGNPFDDGDTQPAGPLQ